MADNNNPKRQKVVAATVADVRCRPLILIASGVFALGACSSSSSSQYQAFCDLSLQMEVASSGPHGQDPAAITDPEKMKEVWATLTDIARQMKTESPAEISDDVALMVDSLVAMDDIFRANNYDLTAMARNEDVRASVDAISQDSKTQEASVRYNAFMKDNCGIS